MVSLDVRMRHIKTVLIASGICFIVALVTIVTIGGAIGNFSDAVNPFSGGPEHWLFPTCMFTVAVFAIVFLCIHLRTRNNMHKKSFLALQTESAEQLKTLTRDLEEQTESAGEMRTALQNITSENARLEREVEAETLVHNSTIHELEDNQKQHKDIQQQVKQEYESLYQELMTENEDIRVENEELRLKLHKEREMERFMTASRATGSERQSRATAALASPRAADEILRTRIAELESENREKTREIQELNKNKHRLVAMASSRNLAPTLTSERTVDLEAIPIPDASASNSSSSPSARSEANAATASTALIPSSMKDNSSLPGKRSLATLTDPEKAVDAGALTELASELATVKNTLRGAEERAATILREKEELQRELSGKCEETDALVQRMRQDTNADRRFLLDKDNRPVALHVPLAKEKENTVQKRVREALSLVTRAKVHKTRDCETNEILTTRQNLMAKLFEKHGWHRFEEEENECNNPQQFFAQLREDSPKKSTLKKLPSAPSFAPKSPKKSLAVSSSLRQLPAVPEMARTPSRPSQPVRVSPNRVISEEAAISGKIPAHDLMSTTSPPTTVGKHEDDTLFSSDGESRGMGPSPLRPGIIEEMESANATLWSASAEIGDSAIAQKYGDTPQWSSDDESEIAVAVRTNKNDVKGSTSPVPRLSLPAEAVRRSAQTASSGSTSSSSSGSGSSSSGSSSSSSGSSSSSSNTRSDNSFDAKKFGTTGDVDLS